MRARLGHVGLALESLGLPEDIFLQLADLHEEPGAKLVRRHSEGRRRDELRHDVEDGGNGLSQRRLLGGGAPRLLHLLANCLLAGEKPRSSGEGFGDHRRFGHRELQGRQACGQRQRVAHGQEVLRRACSGKPRRGGIGVERGLRQLSLAGGDHPLTERRLDADPPALREEPLLLGQMGSQLRIAAMPSDLVFEETQDVGVQELGTSFPGFRAPRPTTRLRGSGPGGPVCSLPFLSGYNMRTPFAAFYGGPRGRSGGVP